MKTHFEYIVIGCGGIGSATAYWLSRRAKGEVLGLEQYDLNHELGGSQDVSRIIRFAYHHPDYTTLLPAALETWKVTEEESGIQLYTPTGGLDFALHDSPHSRWIETYAKAMNASNIPYERLDADAIMRRFPQFHFEEEVDAVYQADTGILHASNGIAVHIALARRRGATILERCPVTEIRPGPEHVTIETPDQLFTARRVVVAVGAWSDQLLKGLGVQLGLTITQEQVTYFATPYLADFAVGRFPFFQWHGDEFFYAFPVFAVMATKIGIDAAGPAVTPDTRTFTPDRQREQKVIGWLRQYVPDFLGPSWYSKTCLYAMTRDRNFVIDILPEYPQVLVVAGAGHAYKFAALLGKVISELAIDGETRYPIATFRIDRPAISNPEFVQRFQI